MLLLILQLSSCIHGKKLHLAETVSKDEIAICFYKEVSITDSSFYLVLDSLLDFYQKAEKSCPLHDGYSHLLTFFIQIEVFPDRIVYSFKADYLRQYSFQRDISFNEPKIFYGVFYYKNSLFVIKQNNHDRYEPFILTGCNIPVFDCKNGYLCSIDLGEMVFQGGLYTCNFKYSVIIDKLIIIH